MAEKKHLYFIDNLRVALTVPVIAHHVGQAYGPTGGYWVIQEEPRAAILAPFFAIDRAYLMSVFFMISGYFMVMSYDRHGPVEFLRGRVRRLGIPLALFAFLIMPVQQYLCHLATGRIEGMSFGHYYKRLYLGIGGSPADTTAPFWPELNILHLWYVEHLLIGSIVYALLRIVWKRPLDTGRVPSRPLGHGTIVALASFLAVTAYIVRLWYPMDKWIGFLGFIQVAFANVPGDLAFFIIGAMAYRRGWFLGFPTRMGYTWLAVGLIGSALSYVYATVLQPVFPLSETAMGVVYPVWEAFTGCGLCIGVFVLFRERINFHGSLSKALARGQYAAYLFHVPLILLIQYWILNIAMSPLAKWALVSAIGVPASFLLAHFLTKPAWARKVL